MSHTKEREEKICLNCGAELTDRYCPVCGQENIEPKETAWGLVSHFFNDITHFDGKFFSTVKYLVTKPGFLSAEYIKGRRASYLHPIRMYVFTSAFFFIIFFSLFPPESFMGGKDKADQLKELMEAGSLLRDKLPATKDTVVKAAILRAINNIDAHAFALNKEIKVKKEKDSVKAVHTKALLDSAGLKIKGKNTQLNEKYLDSIAENGGVVQAAKPGDFNINIDYNSVLAYDSVQKELPADKREKWFSRAMSRKTILIQGKYRNDKNEGMALFMEKYMHTFPQALFVSLPLFALVLLMLYARRNFYYTDHAIFAIHLYCAIFLFLMVYFAIDKLKELSGWQWPGILESLLVLGMFFYAYKAMRKFYGQGRGKTILKFIILNIFSLFIVIILTVSFLFLSLIRFS